MVADALSRKLSPELRVACLTAQPELRQEFVRGEIEVWSEEDQMRLNVMEIQSTLVESIKEKQLQDPVLSKLCSEVAHGKAPGFLVHEDGVLRFQNRVCVPADQELKELILRESHSSAYSVHPGASKMYKDLRRNYWWSNMKQEVVEYVSRCLICQQVKIEHQRPAGELQPLPIPEWKWEDISMDFVVALPRSRKGNDAIWVIVDRLTKSSHFLPIKITWNPEKLAELFLREIVRLHGVPKTIVSDRDGRFTSRFWKSLHAAMGTQLRFSTAFHPQTDGQSERTIQTLEDMLRACALEWPGNWEDKLPLIEFTYNNSWHASIKMAPYEALYGRRCRSPLCWDDLTDAVLIAPELLQKTKDDIEVIRQRLLSAQSRQKSYADVRRRPLEFNVGDHVFVKVSPTKGVFRFGKRGKLSPRYVGPFEILKRVGAVAYQVALPPRMSGMHDVFHVSQLRRYVYHPTHVLNFDDIEFQPDGTFEEFPMRILATDQKRLRNKVIPLVKVLWARHGTEEETWELESEMRRSYPHLFDQSFEDETVLRGGE